MINEGPDLNTLTRFERKYRCSYLQYYAIKNAVYPFVQKDTYTKESPNGKYLVRSLYYDSLDYQLFLEKIGGDSDRVKLRIRTYGNSVHEKPDIRVELKIRRTNLTQKYGAFIDLEEYHHFLDHRHWFKNDDPVLIEFERQVHKEDLHPKVLVEYLREGYQTKDGEGIRITFDHQIKSTASRSLFPEHLVWQNHLEPAVVLEIKHQDQLPGWLQKIIQQHGLRLVANSKFAFGITASRRDLIYPGWSHG